MCKQIGRSLCANNWMQPLCKQIGRNLCANKVDAVSVQTNWTQPLCKQSGCSLYVRSLCLPSPCTLKLPPPLRTSEARVHGGLLQLHDSYVPRHEVATQGPQHKASGQVLQDREERGPALPKLAHSPLLCRCTGASARIAGWPLTS